MLKNYFLAAVLVCAIGTCVTAREVSMSVDMLLQRVAQCNKDVAASRSKHEYVKQGISVAESARLPQVTATLDLSYLGDGTILDRDFSNAMRDKLPHFGNTLDVTLYQPVYQGGAITAGIDLARLQTELAAIGVNQQVEASSIEALACYINLMKMRNLRRVYIENIALTQQLIDNMTERHNQGTAIKNDITRYELRLSTLRYELQTVDNSISVLNNNLVALLSLDPGDQLVPETIDITPGAETEDYWQELTAGSSLELHAIDKSRQISEKSLKLDQASRLPSVGIVLGDHLTGPVTFEIPAINKNYNAWFAGLSVKYSLSSLWTTNKKEKQTRLEMAHIDSQRDAMSSALQRRVHEAYTAMVQARQMLETEKVNVRLANENYEVVSTRFDNDMALLTDMLDASISKLDSEVRLVNANINLMLAYYQLRFISGTLNNR